MLTDRQLQVKRLRDDGLSHRQIARELGVHHKSVWQTLKAIDAKLESLADSEGVVSAATRQGVNLEHLHSGWIKDDSASLYFQAPKVQEEQESFEDRLRAVLEEYEPLQLLGPTSVPDTELLSLYSLWDVHIGLRSWSRETGANFDIKEARRVAIEGIQTLLSRTPNTEKAILLIGGDFTHSDDETASTPASGHSLDVDGRFYKIAEAALGLLITLADLVASKHQEVIVRVLPGNHDPHAAKWLSIALSYLFREGRIQVEADPSEWFHYRFGRTLISCHHGHRRKMDQMAAAIPALRPRDWGETDFRYYFQGHIHHERIGQEVNGVVCRSMAAVTAPDSYAAAMGFSSGRALTAITFHKRTGYYSEMRQPILPRVEEND